MGSFDYQQVTSIKCPIRIVGPDAECPIRIVFCPISIVQLPNFTRNFAAVTQQRVAKPETGFLCARLQKCWRNQKHDAL